MDAAVDGVITESAHVEIRLFGEVELRAADRLLDAGTPRQQAALVVDAGRPVAIETLIDRTGGFSMILEDIWRIRRDH